MCHGSARGSHLLHQSHGTSTVSLQTMSQHGDHIAQSQNRYSKGNGQQEDYVLSTT